jgi:hypothetical protein
MGLTNQRSSADDRFEVDGESAARDFLRSHGIAQKDIETVWTAIAMHRHPAPHAGLEGQSRYLSLHRKSLGLSEHPRRWRSRSRPPIETQNVEIRQRVK